MVEAFRQVGIEHCSRDRLKILVNMAATVAVAANSAAQSLKTHPGIPSGPATFRMLIF